jgi:hypothetical protein
MIEVVGLAGFEPDLTVGTLTAVVESAANAHANATAEP